MDEQRSRGQQLLRFFRPPSRGAAIGAVVLAGVLLAGVVLKGAFAEVPPAPVLAGVPDAGDDAARELVAKTVEVDAAPPSPCPESTRRERVAEGKKAFANGDYPAAREAFDKALECHPDDAEALSERGLAWYTTGDLENAAEDLGLASRKTKNVPLLGTIWYRRGLVDEQRTKTASGPYVDSAGYAAYATAYWIAKHEGARAKVGSPKCGAVMNRLPAAAPAKRFLDDEEVVRKGVNVGALVASLGKNGATRKGIDGTAAGVEFPDVLHYSGRYGDEDWLVAKGSSSWWAFLIGSAPRGCAGDSEFRLDTTRGVLHAHGYLPSGGAEAWTRSGGCSQDFTTGIDAYFDPKRDTVIVVGRPLPGHFSERDALPGPTVKWGPEGVSVTGFGCDETMPWADAPDAGAGTLDAGADAADAADAGSNP